MRKILVFLSAFLLLSGCWNQTPTENVNIDEGSYLSENEFKAEDGSWSVNYPVGWQVKSDGNTADFKAVEFENEVDSGDITFYVIKDKSGKELVDEFQQNHDEVLSNQIGKGTMLEGTVKSDVIGMMPPGTFEVETYITIKNNQTLVARLNNMDMRDIYNDMVEVVK